MPSNSPQPPGPLDQALFQLMLQHSHEVICLHEPDGRYRHLGHAILPLLGYQPNELIGKYPWDYIHPSEREALKASFSLAFEAERSPPLREYRYRHAKGEYKWLQSQVVAIRNSTGEIVQLLSTTRDISDLVALREKNETTERMLEQASHMATLGGWELDVPSRQPVWSKVTYDIHEWEHDSPPPFEQALQFFPSPADQLVEKCINDAIELGKEFDFVAPFISAKNKRKWVRSIGQAVQRDGKTLKLIGVFQDVSRETEYNLELKNIARQLQHQQSQMQDISQIISHNLRSPVTNLNLLTDFIDRAKDQDERSRYLNELRQVSTDIEDLLTDLVSVMRATKKEGLPSRDLDLKLMLMKVKDKLAVEIESSMAKVESDFSAWHQLKYPEPFLETILGHLISNAIRYRSAQREPHIVVYTKQEDGHHQLCVRDNGSGIDLKRQGNKIFKIYKTFHREKGGKGIGLFTVRSYVNALGGEIRVESQPGQGSTFIIDFDYYNPVADWPRSISNLRVAR